MWHQFFAGVVERYYLLLWPVVSVPIVLVACFSLIMPGTTRVSNRSIRPKEEERWHIHLWPSILHLGHYTNTRLELYLKLTYLSHTTQPRTTVVLEAVKKFIIASL